jgi:hypothetical protein
MNKGFLVMAQDIRGHFVIGKVFIDKEKAKKYEEYLKEIGCSKPMGEESRYIDIVETFEVEIE